MQVPKQCKDRMHSLFYKVWISVTVYELHPILTDQVPSNKNVWLMHKKFSNSS